MADTSSAASPPRRPPGAIAGLQSFDRALGVVEQAVLCALLALLIVVAAGQAIAARLFEQHWSWSHEVIRYSVFFIAMAGAALSAQSERLISMDFLIRLMPPRRRAWLRQGLRIFSVVVCAYLVVGGLGIRDIVAGEEYEVVGKGTVALALPIGAGLIALHLALHFVIDLLYLTRGELPPESQEVAAH